MNKYTIFLLVIPVVFPLFFHLDYFIFIFVLHLKRAKIYFLFYEKKLRENARLMAGLKLYKNRQNTGKSIGLCPAPLLVLSGDRLAEQGIHHELIAPETAGTRVCAGCNTNSNGGE
jgi:hypothetical protein